MFRLAMERSMEDTPQKANDAPQNQDTTPLKSDTTPLKSDTTPLKSDTTPLKSDTTPLKSDTTPLKSDATPLKSDTTPLMSDTTPLKSDTTPLKSDSTPRKQVNFSGLDDEMDKSLPKRYQATPHRGGNGLPHSPVVKTILDACTDYDGQNVDQTSVDHNYVADDNDGVNSDKTDHRGEVCIPDLGIVTLAEVSTSNLLTNEANWMRMYVTRTITPSQISRIKITVWMRMRVCYRGNRATRILTYSILTHRDTSSTRLDMN